MKKVLILLGLVLFGLPSYAIYWHEFSHKSYIDLDSVTGTQYKKRAWLKLLNPGHWELIDNKKIWFVIEYAEVICSPKATETRTLHYTAYDVNNNILKTWEYRDSPFHYVVPDTVGETWSNAICASPLMNN